MLSKIFAFKACFCPGLLGVSVEGPAVGLTKSTSSSPPDPNSVEDYDLTPYAEIKCKKYNNNRPRTASLCLMINL